MRYAFLTPIIVWLPPGYDCTIVMPTAALAPMFAGQSGKAERYWVAYAEGEAIAEGSEIFEFRNGRQLFGPETDLVWRAADRPDLPRDGGYLEFGMRALGNELVFVSKALPSFYNVYNAPGRKNFFACHSWKFGVPHAINQIARFGHYVDGYPHLHIDRRRDIGESLVLVNPYRQAILARLLTHDGRRPPRQRVPALSVRRILLEELLKPGEEEWFGHLRLTANNRLVTTMVKHALSDPANITTIEHLDPFRADQTHAPLSRWVRLAYGAWAYRRRAMKGES